MAQKPAMLGNIRLVTKRKDFLCLDALRTVVPKCLDTCTGRLVQPAGSRHWCENIETALENTCLTLRERFS